MASLDTLTVQPLMLAGWGGLQTPPPLPQPYPCKNMYGLVGQQVRAGEEERALITSFPFGPFCHIEADRLTAK